VRCNSVITDFVKFRNIPALEKKEGGGVYVKVVEEEVRVGSD